MGTENRNAAVLDAKSLRTKARINPTGLRTYSEGRLVFEQNTTPAPRAVEAMPVQAGDCPPETLSCVGLGVLKKETKSKHEAFVPRGDDVSGGAISISGAPFPTHSSSWETNMSGCSSSGSSNNNRDRSNSNAGGGTDSGTETLHDSFSGTKDSIPPNLVDEDDDDDEEDEEEMLSLEKERLRQKTQFLNVTHEGQSSDHHHFEVGSMMMGMAGLHSREYAPSLRRTPGANVMHRSAIERTTPLRRTPGATAMHRSLRHGDSDSDSRDNRTSSLDPSANNEASVLGFGLTLSTPVGAGRHVPPSHNGVDPPTHDALPPPTPSATPLASGNARRPPLASVSRAAPAPDAGKEQGSIYTPAGLTLSKNPYLQLDGLRSAFSPNTIRLTESLDNLLHDEDEEENMGRPSKPALVRSSSSPELNVAYRLPSADSHDSTLRFPSKSHANEDWSETYTFKNANKAGADEEIKVLTRHAPNNNPKKTRTNDTLGRRSRNGVYPKISDDRNANQTTKPIQPSPQHPKPLHHLQTSDTQGGAEIGRNGCFQRYARNPPTSQEDGSDFLSRPKPLNFDPSGAGAFAPPPKQQRSRSEGQQEPTHSSLTDGYHPQDGASFHTPTPKKVRNQNPAGDQYQQIRGNNSDFNMMAAVGNPQQIVIHHHHHYNGYHPPDFQHNSADGYFHANSPKAMNAPLVGFVPNRVHMGHPHPHFDFAPYPPQQAPSPLTIPPVSPMTLPSYPPADGSRVHNHHHHHMSIPHQYAQHSGALPPFAGMTVPPTWSPPPSVHPVGHYGGPVMGGGEEWNVGHGGGGWDPSAAGRASAAEHYPYNGTVPPHQTLLGHASPPPLPPNSPFPPAWMGEYSDQFPIMTNPSVKDIRPQATILETHTESHAAPRQSVASTHSMKAQPSQAEARTNLVQEETVEFKTCESKDTEDMTKKCSESRLKPSTHSKEGIDPRKNAVTGASQKIAKEKVQRNQQPKQQTKKNGQPQKSPPKGKTRQGSIVDGHLSKAEQRKSDQNVMPNTTSSSPKKKSSLDSPRKKKLTQPKNLTEHNGDGVGSTAQPPMVSVSNKGEQPQRISPPMNPAEQKKAELVESPATRLAFKDFYRKFRVKERQSFQQAEEFALQCLRDESLPSKVHWRVHLELADLAKRANKFDEARRLYRKVCHLQPYANQGWLEFSKLEEECGELDRCTQLLYEGLSHCEYNENLLTRAIKHEERMGNLSRARQLLARLKHVGIEKVWRTVLEGALLEARAGNTAMARRVLKYLMHHVPWYGPLYLEAYRLERDACHAQDALAIVERGLKEIPRYGPLWFGAFRLCEGLDLSENSFDLPRTMRMINRAAECISRELLWKVHLEAAQAQERAALLAVDDDQHLDLDEQLNLSRQSFAKTILFCPPNLCWKVWLAGGRMELSCGFANKARSLFLRAFEVVPEKGRPAVLLESARLEEFAGDKDLARAILCKSRHEAGSDWKVWLESVALEIRSNERARAIYLAHRALEVHTGTGRLWAALVQLRQPDGERYQSTALKRALRAVPKSGEVWCEGARIHLNPFVPTFDLERATLHLTFATRFTPQYGDSFLETMRLELLSKWIVPVAERFALGIEDQLQKIVSSRPIDWEITNNAIRRCVRQVAFEIKSAVERRCEHSSEDDQDVLPGWFACLDAEFVKTIDTSDLELRCANADPNYGKLWFHCRSRPTDTARIVLRRAKMYLAKDIFDSAHIYIAAMLRRAVIVAVSRQELYGATREFGDETEIQFNSDWDDMLENRLRTAPLLDEILKGQGDDVVLLENTASGSDFVTGLVDLNKHHDLDSLSLIERRKVLFGSDLLLSWKPA